MKIAGRFEKVSLTEYSRAIKHLFGALFDDEKIRETYENIKIPKRMTKGSAGYDFFAPFYFYLPSWGDIVIPTGIKADINEGWVLEIHPRGGSGMKHYLRIANTTGIIDEDYYGNPKNEGHIMIKLRKESGLRDTSTPSRDVEFRAGDAYCQGIFKEFGITCDDESEGERTGGFGSTGN